MTKAEQVALWLDLFETLTIKRKYEILQTYDTPEQLFDNFTKDYKKFEAILDKLAFNKMVYALDSDFLQKQKLQYDRMGVKIVTLYSKSYPEPLSQIATPPLVLYCKGDIDLLKSECLAVVGTRYPTRYGERITQNFVKDLVANNFTIVSGMVYGVDTIAHKTTLQEGGKTIAVLGGGVNEIYPTANIPLSKQIIEFGLIISEYKPDTRPTRYNFPVRNRIIAGLSRGVLITEAKLKSGSMHTKEYALEAGRDLFVVPGNIDNPASEGCNQMIKNLQGCMVTSAQDILDVYGKTKITKKIATLNNFQISIDEQMIIDIIGKEEAHYEELLAKTNLDTKTLNTLLTTLQVRGIIKKLAGNIYSI